MTDARSAQTALDKLIEAVEAGFENGMRGLPDAMAFSAAAGIKDWSLVWKSSHGSLDAALAMHEALLPGWYWSATKIGRMVVTSPDLGAEHDGLLDSDHDVMPPARAWLLAILRAYRSIQL